MILSKTNFVTFLDCNKNAWLKIHRPDIYNKYPLSSFDQNIIDTGNQIDALARDLFPGGVTVHSRDDTKHTSQLLSEQVPVIYQPVFETKKFITASDIFVWNPEAELYDVYEVKASTASDEGGGRKTEDYLIDLAFQKVVLNQLGISVGTLNLIRLNKEYVRHGVLKVDELFIKENVTDQVNGIVYEISKQMDLAFEYLSKKAEPEGYCDCITKGKNSHCTTSAYSNPGLPEYSVHSIARINKKKLSDLVDQNILEIKDVPIDFELSENQRRQVDTAQSGKIYINSKGIEDFLNTLKYPLAFLDYETYPSALPKFDGYRPYQQIPFQFSLHIVESPESEPIHQEFIYTEKENPDKYFAEALKNYLPKTGSVIVWNEKFEKGINEQIGQRLSEAQELMQAINSRVVDLMVPFSGKTLVYDHPAFKGSASIKYVLPALVPHLSYKELHIKEGGTASNTWNRIVSDEFSEKEKNEEIDALKKYCHLDTLAMVEIWRALNDKIS